MYKENMWKIYENVAEYDIQLFKDYYKLNDMIKSDARFCMKGKRKQLKRTKQRTLGDCRWSYWFNFLLVLFDFYGKRQSLVKVTSLREGGDTRGCPLER
jgi:hypothetical protein